MAKYNVGLNPGSSYQGFNLYCYSEFILDVVELEELDTQNAQVYSKDLFRSTEPQQHNEPLQRLKNLWAAVLIQAI